MIQGAGWRDLGAEEIRRSLEVMPRRCWLQCAALGVWEQLSSPLVRRSLLPATPDPEASMPTGRGFFSSEVLNWYVFVKNKKAIHLFFPLRDDIFQISHFCAASQAFSPAINVLDKL